MKWITVLRVGGEGGDITLLGQDNGDDVWKYKLTTDETTLMGILSEEDAEGVDFTSTSPVAEDWESIIELLGKKYPHWMNMHPLECHSLFRKKVWRLLSERNKTSKTRNTKKWLEVLNKGAFPPPPVKGSKLLVPITTRAEMFCEIKVTSVQCDGFWKKNVDDGVAYFFRWMGKPRATVLVIWGHAKNIYIECRKIGNLPVTGKEFKIVYAEVIKLFQDAGLQAMTDIENAKQLFQEAGLAFPTLPEKLAVRLRKRGEWHFSTRKIKITPYFLKYYVEEVNGTHVKDYATLAHSGQGRNSWALHYYIVFGPLRMFLQLGWGGIYMDADAAAAKIHECFLLADQIVSLAKSVCKESDKLTIVGSDFHGSYLEIPGQDPQEETNCFRDPVDVLIIALQWMSDNAEK